MPAHNVVVIGASAGGITAVRTLLNGLRENIEAAIFVVVHTSPDGPGLLPSVLGRGTKLNVVNAEDGMTIAAGSVYVAPPDFHLIIDGRQVRLTHGPREHRFRPAIDPLFRTAVEHFGHRTLGVVMSGHMADGTHGMMLIKRAGGVTIVQDPDEAEVPTMPLNAMRRVKVDYVLPVSEMARVIMGVLANPPHRGRRSEKSQRGPDSDAPSAERPGRTDALRTNALKGPASGFTCPDCGGALWELKEGDLVRYRCHVGHGFTAESLREGMTENVEDALWTAVRAIEEAIELRTRMRARVRRRKLTAFSSKLDEEIVQLKARSDALRDLLLARPPSQQPPVHRPRNRQRYA